jgi:threonine dehydrogenase-like Zn-dependent dehydrogenase
MAYTNLRGVDACLETSGNVVAQRLCIDMVRRRGKISLIGECGNDLASSVQQRLYPQRD